MTRSALITERQSEVRSLQKEFLQLRRAYYSREWIELDKPIRNGWSKHLKIKEAILDTKHGELYQAICDKVTLKVGGTLKEDCTKRWGRKLKKGRHIRLPGICGITREELKKLPAAARKHFVYYVFSNRYHGGKVYMCMLAQSYFEEVYSRAYITHVLPVDSEALKRMDEIDEILLSETYYKYSWNANTWYNAGKYSRKTERRIIRMELDEIDRTNMTAMLPMTTPLSKPHTSESVSS